MSDRRFKVIPVLDVLHGQAVRAVGGMRSHYRPIRSRLHPGSEPLPIARAYRDQLGLDSLYVADLDAILGAEPNRSLYRELGSLGLDLWIDAGIEDASDARKLQDLLHVTLVLGLETIRGPKAVRRTLDLMGKDRVVLSLDLRDGAPLVADGAEWSSQEPITLGDELIALGVGRFLLLDLARVGTGRGTGTGALLRELREKAIPDQPLEVSVGGGIATIEDVSRARSSGAAAVLIGSALHDGRITRSMLDSLG